MQIRETWKKNREEMAREDETWGEFRWLALDRHK